MDNLYFEFTMDMLLNSTLQEKYYVEDEYICKNYILDNLDIMPESYKKKILDDAKEKENLKEPDFVNIKFCISYYAAQKSLYIDLYPVVYDKSENSEYPKSNPLDFDDGYEMKFSKERENKLLNIIGIIRKTKIDKVINKLQAIRDQEDGKRPWMYERDENGHGTLRKDVMAVDVIPILEELKDYEIFCTEEQIEELKKQSPDSLEYLDSDLTENSDKVDRDFVIISSSDFSMGLFCINTGETTNSDSIEYIPFASKIPESPYETIMDFDSCRITKDIDGLDNEYYAKISATSSNYEVYCYKPRETNKEMGWFSNIYENGVKEILLEKERLLLENERLKEKEIQDIEDYHKVLAEELLEERYNKSFREKQYEEDYYYYNRKTDEEYEDEYEEEDEEEDYYDKETDEEYEDR